MSTKVLKYISVCLLVLAFGALGTAQAAVTVGTNAVTSDGALTITGATASAWSTSAGALTITAAGASTWSAGAGDLTIDAVGGSLVLDSGETAADAIRIVASAAAGGIDIDAGTGGIDMATTIATGDAFDIVAASLTTADLFDIDAAAITDGDFFDIAAPTTRVAGSAIKITDASVAATVTGDLIQIDVTGTPDTNTIDIDVTGITTAASNAFDVTYSSVAALGNAIDLNMGTNLAGQAIDINLTGVRTDDGINIDDDSTGNTPVLDMNISGIRTGNAIDITYATAAATENAIDLNMGTNLAGQAIDINLTGVRTDDGINIDDDSTGNTPVLDMNISGIRTGNAIDITYATTAATENAIDLNMGTNVAGMAISVASAATGTSGEGSAFDVLHTGDLAAGADVVSIDTTGSISSTSNVLSVTQRTGAGTAGAYAVYVSATGANVEGLKVDDGTSAFDEAVTVTTAAVATAPFTVTGLDNQTAAVLDLNVNNVSGTLIDVDYAAETQTGDLTGLDLNLNTNVTGVTDFDVTGVNVQTPALTPTDTLATTTYTGYNISAAGALDTATGDVAVATLNWRGVNITIPAIDSGSTLDVVTATGVLISAGTVTDGLGTETSTGIDATDSDLGAALSIGANTILSTGTVTFNRADAGTVTLTALDSDANAALTVSSGGTGILTLDAGSTGSIVIGSADVTSLTAIVDNDVIIQNGATGNVTMDFRDYADSTDDDMAHAILTVNCTDATTGAEDCDLTIGVVEAGAAADTRLSIDADGGVTIGSVTNNSFTVTTDGTGDAEVVLPGLSVGEAELTASSGTGLGVLRTARAKYDFAVDGGVTGLIAVTSTATLPDNAVIVAATINSTTAVLSGGAATLAVGTTAGSSATSILAATAKASLSADALINGVPVFATPVKMTAAGNISVTVGTADLTAGVVEITLYYYVAAN